MPASSTTWRPPRSRTCRTRATQPAGARDEGPPGLDRQARRPPVGGDRLEQRRQLPRESRRRPAPARRAAGPGTRRRCRACRTLGRCRASSASSASPRRTASRHASTAPSCDPTWRWIPRGRTARRRPPPTSTAADSSSAVIPNFDAAGADRQPAAASRARPPGSAGRGRRARAARPPEHARAAIRTSASASSSDSIATHRSGAPSRAARTAARRSASVLPTPSSVIRSFGRPARRATAHSPRETTLASKPSAATAATIAATSLALTEYARSHGSGNAARTRSAAASSVARSVT